MSVVTTTAGCRALNRRLISNNIPYWIGQSNGDSHGKYLLFKKGGECVSSAGWNLIEASSVVNDLIAGKGSSIESESI